MAILIFPTAGDGQRAQNNLINNLNANYGVLPSIQNGFCFILVTEWLIEFLGHPRNPHDIFLDITGDLPLLRQLSHNFNTYVSDILTPVIIPTAGSRRVRRDIFLFQKAEQVVTLMSNGTRDIRIEFFERVINPLPPVFNTLNLRSRREGFLLIFDYRTNGVAHSHAMGMVHMRLRVGDRYYFYDPNAGVYSCSSILDVFHQAPFNLGADPNSIRVIIFKVR